MNIISKLFFRIFHKCLSFHQEYIYEGLRKTYRIPKDFRFNGPNVLIYGNGKIQIGSNSYIGSYSTIQLGEGNTVFIGSNCSISHNVRMYTISHDPDQDFNRVKNKPKKEGDIIIGDGVWIGANVFINPGVTIGRNTVIGANSVVTKNLEENAIYGGIPAKLIRYKSIHYQNLIAGTTL